MHSRLGFVLFSFAALLVLAALIALGTWQVHRLQWKEALIASVNERIEGTPIPLGQMEQQFIDTGDVDYYPVRVAGRFLHDGEAHYHNTHKGSVGWHVYTPLELDDGRILFVNRGFIVDVVKDADKRQAGQISERVEISGLARNALSEKPSSIVPDNNLAKNQFFWRDLSAMVEHAALKEPGRVLTIIVDAGADAPPSYGQPLGGITRISFPNNHLGYVITWYGLALALIRRGQRT